MNIEAHLQFTGNNQEALSKHQNNLAFFKKLETIVKSAKTSVKNLAAFHNVPLEVAIIFNITKDDTHEQ